MHLNLLESPGMVNIKWEHSLPADALQNIC